MMASAFNALATRKLFLTSVTANVISVVATRTDSGLPSTPTKFLSIDMSVPAVIT